MWHFYVVRSAARDALAAHPKAAGIQTQLNHPRALPFLPRYTRFAYGPSDFPVAYARGQECLSLPLFPEMTERQIARVADAVSAFAGPAAQRLPRSGTIVENAKRAPRKERPFPLPDLDPFTGGPLEAALRHR